MIFWYLAFGILALNLIVPAVVSTIAGAACGTFMRRVPIWLSTPLGLVLGISAIGLNIVTRRYVSDHLSVSHSFVWVWLVPIFVPILTATGSVLVTWWLCRLCGRRIGGVPMFNGAAEVRWARFLIIVAFAVGGGVTAWWFYYKISLAA